MNERLNVVTSVSLARGWDAVVLLPGTCDPYNDKVSLSEWELREGQT